MKGHSGRPDFPKRELSMQDSHVSDGSLDDSCKISSRILPKSSNNLAYYSKKIQNTGYLVTRVDETANHMKIQDNLFDEISFENLKVAPLKVEFCAARNPPNWWFHHMLRVI